MPLVEIKIDQAAKPAGIPGQAREDLDTGTPAVVTAVGGPFRAYRWTIVDKPVDFDANVISAAGILAPTQSSTSITPIDKQGTYLIQVEIDSGLGLGATADDIARLTFYAGPTLATNADELPQRIPAARETTEHNVPNPAYPSGNPIGWAYSVGRWLAGITRRLFRVGARAGARVSTALVGPTVTEIRKLYVSSVTFDGVGTYTVGLLPAFPDVDYGVIVTPHESADYGHPFTWAVTVTGSSSFEIAFFDASNNPTGADFTVVAVLGDEP